MRILTFKSNAELRLGLNYGSKVLDVSRAAAALSLEVPNTIDALMLGGFDALQQLIALEQAWRKDERSDSWMISYEDLVLGSCVSSSGKLICVGLNYQRHAAEAGLPVPKTPILFSKYANSFATTHEPIPLPPIAVEYDYEAELVVVIGKEGKYIPREQALSYVLGYTNGNDISARDLQSRTSQWMLGKTLDKFMPIGPYLVTHHDVPDPQNLTIKCWFNGDLCQSSNTKDMVFSVAEVVHYASQYLTLSPGDILTTGTPEGVIFGNENPRWMQPGDEVIIEIENLGRLVNTMIEDPQYKEA
jgi:2-keto-4-pentenoate hydratase/2-oxohepta-3-ene-1,7-dioic acid hydratase in catechol pathway